jgi:hypothetical protein
MSSRAAAISRREAEKLNLEGQLTKFFWQNKKIRRTEQKLTQRTELIFIWISPFLRKIWLSL